MIKNFVNGVEKTSSIFAELHLEGVLFSLNGEPLLWQSALASLAFAGLKTWNARSATRFQNLKKS